MGYFLVRRHEARVVRVAAEYDAGVPHRMETARVADSTERSRPVEMLQISQSSSVGIRRDDA